MQEDYEIKLLESYIALGEMQQIKELEDRLNNIDKFKAWQADPMLWLEERLGEDPISFQWSLHNEYLNHEWDGDKDPLASAWKAIADGKWCGVESATGTGKTFALARIVFWFLDVFMNSLVVTSAPKSDQLKLHLWSEISRAFSKFKRIRPYAELQSLKLRVDGRKNNDSESDKDSHMAVGFIAGIAANEESTTKAQGFHREHMLIITEETPGMPQPTLNAFEQTSTGSHNLLLAVGNPDNVTDPLHFFVESYPGKVVPIRISGLDHPNVVKGIEVIPGAVSRGSIANRKQKFGEEHDFYKSRVRGICPKQGTDSLIKHEWIMQCIPGTPEYEAKGEIKPGARVNAVGVDVANSMTGDKACCVWGRGNVVTDIEEFQCPNSNALAYNLIFNDHQLAERGIDNYHTSKTYEYDIMPENIGVDPVGVGAGTVNTFKTELGFEVTSLHGGQKTEMIPTQEFTNPQTGKIEERPLFEFNSWRSQGYWQLADDLLKRRVKLDISKHPLLRQLIKELLIIRYSLKGTKISIEPKENIVKRLGHSPNTSDGLMYWNWTSQTGDMTVGDIPFLM